MKILALFLSLCAGLLLVFTVLAGVSSVTLQKTDLAPSGEAYEINRGSDGFLYISDYTAKQIWREDPVNLIVKKFQFAINVSDAKPDNSGNIWFTDGGPTFARLNPNTNLAVYWEVPITHNLNGLTFDGSGKVWMTEWFSSVSNIYSFDITSTELCTYTLPRDGGVPGSSQSFYILSHLDKLWIANRGEQKIYSLDPAQNQATWWQIPESASRPLGIAFDAQNNLWWADEGLGALASLNPTTAVMTRYNLPNTAKPQMIVLVRDAVWYTAAVTGSPGNLGVLYPKQVSGITSSLVSHTYPISKQCFANWGAGTTLFVSATTPVQIWTPADITTSFDTSAWQVYQLPAGSNPYGINFTNDQIWAIDQGRKELMRLPFKDKYFIYLPQVMR